MALSLFSTALPTGSGWGDKSFRKGQSHSELADMSSFSLRSRFLCVCVQRGTSQLARSSIAGMWRVGLLPRIVHRKRPIRGEPLAMQSEQLQHVLVGMPTPAALGRLQAAQVRAGLGKLARAVTLPYRTCISSEDIKLSFRCMPSRFRCLLPPSSGKACLAWLGWMWSSDPRCYNARKL